MTMRLDRIYALDDSCSIIQGHAVEILRDLSTASVQCCVTSPPYFGLRDYGLPETTWGDGWVGCLGLEPRVEMYVAHVFEIFSEVKRVLRDDGLLWIVLGDSYNNRTKVRSSSHQPSLNGFIDDKWSDMGRRRLSYLSNDLKEKDLMMMPAEIALALRADGWYLRDQIVWAKPNPMPGSQKDRCTSSYEFVYMLAKSKKYYFDYVAIQDDAVGKTPHDLTGQGYDAPGQTKQNGNRNRDLAEQRVRQSDGQLNGGTEHSTLGTKRTKRNVWTIATHPCPEAHFAVFPQKLIEPMILAGSADKACSVCGAPWRRVVEHTKMEWREGPTRDDRLESTLESGRIQLSGTMMKPPTTTTTGWEPTCEHGDGESSSLILDPFCGSGTAALVARRLGRRFIGVDLSVDYCQMARRRILGE